MAVMVEKRLLVRSGGEDSESCAWADLEKARLNKLSLKSSESDGTSDLFLLAGRRQVCYALARAL